MHTYTYTHMCSQARMCVHTHTHTYIRPPLPFIILLQLWLFFNWQVITLQYYDGFAIYQHESVIGLHLFPPSRTNPPDLSPHLIPPGCHRAPALGASYIKLPLAVYITYSSIYVSVLFSQIIPPSPSSHWMDKEVVVYIHNEVLLLSRFSHVRLCVTP